MRVRDKIRCKRDYERFLRRHGWTAMEAKRIVSVSWNMFRTAGAAKLTGDETHPQAK